MFFGLSGTGKTTLSADADRPLIGDDEHGWADDGVFNFEGGCYAKVIRLSPDGRARDLRTTRCSARCSRTWSSTRRPRRPTSTTASATENTRGGLSARARSRDPCRAKRAGHPSAIIFLTCDAFGVLPPLARLTPEQAMYHFLSGYTAKVAGTEVGVTEPQATFSACFGAPFLPLPPGVYADLLGELIEEHGVERLAGQHRLDRRRLRRRARACRSRPPAPWCAPPSRASWTTRPPAPTRPSGSRCRCEVPGVDAELLDPRSTWDDPEAYDRAAADLAGKFSANFETYAEGVTDAIAAAGPRAAAGRS